MSQSISAPAISRILKAANFRKALTGRRQWSTGFSVVGYGGMVRVDYTDVTSDKAFITIGEMADAINGREDKKYFAKVHDGKLGRYVEVVLRDETDPEQNAQRKAEALEKLAEQSPYAPNLADVTAALRTYDTYGYAEGMHSGWIAERDHEDSRLVRVTYRDMPWTTYKGDRDTQVLQTLLNYVRVLEKVGFSTKLIEDEWAVLVGTEGEFWREDKAAKEALDELREEVEKDLSISTRRATAHSIVVIRQLPFKAKSVRLEVFYFEGEYKSTGQFGKGGVKFSSDEASKTAQYVMIELAD